MIPPNSRYIEQRLSEIKNRKGKNAFLETIMSDAETVILKLEHITTGLFNEAIDYLVRNEIPYGNIVLINKYRKVRLITYKDIRNEGYLRKTKGFL